MRAAVLCAFVAASALTSQVALAQPAAQPAPDAQPAAQPPPEGDKQPPIAKDPNAPPAGPTVIVVEGGKKDDAPPPEKHYGARFRSGVQLEGGVLAVPAVKVNFGSIGLATQLGAQVNDLVGIYDQPAFDIVIGDFAGVYLTNCILVDFTVIDRITIGVGPEVGALLAFNPNGFAAVANYGARIHFAGYPLIGRSSTGPRRNAMQLGLDTSLLYGGFGGLSVADGGSATADAGFQLHAQLTFGYAGI